MADEIRVVPDGAEIDDPEAARAEIAHTRARMSGTIDEIEDALLRRKERMQNRLDPFTAVRERPLQAAGIVFGVGLVLGLLTGGDDDDEEREYRRFEYDFESDPELDRSLSYARASRFESRPKRFLHLEPEYEYAVDDYEDWDEDDDDLGAFQGVRDAIAERLGPLVRGLARQFIDGNRSS
jgi:ElaB/YqjD/DUF883 family membrane-anchored ribosome-binding protein